MPLKPGKLGYNQWVMQQLEWQLSLTAEQSAYLATMGITQWHKQTLHGEVPSGAARTGQAGMSGTSEAVSNPVGSDSWQALRNEALHCTACELHHSRTQVVFGVGNPTAELMVIGEAPGADEDRQGEPFVGRAGQLLNEMLKAIGLPRDQVYIANILKCRPPNNRDPKPEEAEQCVAYLYRQIQLVQPRVIMAVGRIAAQRLLKTDAALSRLRGKQHLLAQTQTPFIVTYHPAYLLRSPIDKRKAWEDLLFVKQMLDSRSESREFP